MSSATAARLLALLIPAALLAGAWGFQLIGGYPPCEMCHWQRWPHYAAVVVALLAWIVVGQPRASKLLVVIAGLLIIVSGGIGVFHAGVEQHWWAGPQHCTGGGFSGSDPLKALLAQKVVQCDIAAWKMFGISIAGWNAILSILGGLAVLVLASKAKTR